MIQIDELSKAIEKELTNYSTNVAFEVEKAVDDVSSDLVSNLKTQSPKRTGAYRRGWRSKVAYHQKGNKRVLIHNTTNYQLTHLLEYGHAKRNGGRVQAKPHIAPNEKIAIQEFMKRVERAVKGN